MTKQQEQLLINQHYIGWRYDAAIADLMPEYSRSKISTWIKAGYATFNQTSISGKEKIKQTGIIDILIENQDKQNWQAEDIELNIIDEDEDILIINKPAGLVTHPGAGNMQHTLANALLHYQPELSQLDRAGIVHRLDKETSGLLVVAKTQLAQHSLIRQLQSHQVYREYIAICYGHMIAGGTLDKPIGRHPKNRIKQAVNTINGKKAITHYRILERFKHHSMISVVLETGRTHQIRVHLDNLGHSLVGDKLYGKNIAYAKGASIEFKQALKSVKRHCLHAKTLTLIHPKSNQEKTWQTELPYDIKHFLTQLKQYNALTD